MGGYLGEAPWGSTRRKYPDEPPSNEVFTRVFLRVLPAGGSLGCFPKVLPQGASPGS